MIPSSLDLQSCMSIGDLSKFRNITVAVEFDVFNILNSKFGHGEGMEGPKFLRGRSPK